MQHQSSKSQVYRRRRKMGDFANELESNMRRNHKGYEQLSGRGSDSSSDNVEASSTNAETSANKGHQKHDGSKTGEETFGEYLKKLFASSSKNRLAIASFVCLLILSVLLAGGLALLFCLTFPVEVTENPHDGICTTAGCVRSAAVLLDSIDFSKNPCDDFYEYACGNWIKNNRIPDDRSRFTSFAKADERVKEQLKSLFEDKQISSEAESIRFVRRLYDSCSDTKAVNSLKSRPFNEKLDEIGGWPLLMQNWASSKANLTQLSVWTLKRFANHGLARISVESDAKNVSNNIITIDQSRLGLGYSTRDYYLNDTAYGDQIKAYKNLIQRFAKFVADDMQIEVDDNRFLTAIEEQLNFERSLARIIVPEEDRRNATLLYNKMTLKQFQEIFTSVDWEEFFKAVLPDEVFDRLISNHSNSFEIIVTQPEFFKQLNELLMKTDQRILANYLIWLSLRAIDSALDSRFEDANQDFKLIFSGRMQKPVRWKLCMAFAYYMEQATGAMYIREFFTPSDRTEALAMIKNLKQAFSEIVKELDWMDKRTKDTALEKIDYMIDLVGYPDFALNDSRLDAYYQNMTYDNKTFYDMIMSVLKWSDQRQWYDLLKSFERDRFRTSPAIVNAFYGPDTNSITFPAGILQPPFFHGSYPKYINYAAIGSVIGHEITHGFDDQGSQYDKIGNLRNWWSQSAELKFRSKTQCIVDQYSQYEVPEIKKRVNGKLTQGENIADNGGIKESLRAYRIYLKQNGQQELRLPGLNLTNEQAFFASYAQFWCSKSKIASLINQILTDPHSPERFRIIGVVSNFEEFANAYSCPSGSPMNPVKKCSVW